MRRFLLFFVTFLLVAFCRKIKLRNYVKTLSGQTAICMKVAQAQSVVNPTPHVYGSPPGGEPLLNPERKPADKTEETDKRHKTYKRLQLGVRLVIVGPGVAQHGDFQDQDQDRDHGQDQVQ